jgi:hypothetical protein
MRREPAICARFAIHTGVLEGKSAAPPIELANGATLVAQPEVKTFVRCGVIGKLEKHQPFLGDFPLVDGAVRTKGAVIDQHMLRRASQGGQQRGDRRLPIMQCPGRLKDVAVFAGGSSVKVGL